MTWTSLSPLLSEAVSRRGLTRALGAAELIELFNIRAAASFGDPEHRSVRAISYREKELTVFCKSPLYAAEVRRRKAELIDPVRRMVPLPLASLRFIFKNPDSASI